VRLVGDAGAYPSVGAFLPGGTRRMAQGTYAFPTIEFDVAVAVTNTTPMGAYRGAGRPEATALLERLVDQAALELGIDPIEIRRRNFLADDVFPFRTLTGNTYDSGRYTFPLDRAAEASGYDALRAEQARRRDAGDTCNSASGWRRTSRSPPVAARTSSVRSSPRRTAPPRSSPAPSRTGRVTRPPTRCS
jgi:aerobic carbon-monoxide dehydrogenase large subunit